MMVFKFGVRRFIEGHAAAHAEMRDAGHLFNALVAIERWRRRAYGEIRSRYVPGLFEIDTAYEQLSDWIGDHSGPSGARGKIRGKRQEASAPKTKGGKATPTKKVDVEKELTDIEIMKQWRKAAGEQAKPMREAFAAFVDEPSLVYEARTRGVSVKRLKERNRIREITNAALKEATKKGATRETKTAAKQAKSDLEKYSDQLDADSRKTHTKKKYNASVRAEMLEEPWHDAWKDLTRLDAVVYWLQNWMKGAHNLNHGTYTAVKESVIQAGKKPKPRPDGEPRRPKIRPAFARSKHDRDLPRLRKMGWQVQGGISWGAILSGKCRDLRVRDMRLRPESKNEHKWLATMQIRITQSNGISEWVSVEVAVHRPIPDDTKITWIYLVPEERLGGKMEYSVQLTATPTSPLIQRAVGTGHVHVSLKWTQRGDTLEVADINGEPLLLPHAGQCRVKKHQQRRDSIPARLRYAASLRHYADIHFNTARAELVKQLDKMPSDVQEMCKNIEHWQRHEPLRRVSNVLANDTTLKTWHDWRENRKEKFVSFETFEQWASEHGVSSEQRFACWLETWRLKDTHLEQVAEGATRAAIAARRDFYKVTAARLSERYETCSLGGAVDLAALALRDKSEDKPVELHQIARRNRTLAAVSEFKETLIYVFGERMRDAPETGGAREGRKRCRIE